MEVIIGIFFIIYVVYRYAKYLQKYKKEESFQSIGEEITELISSYDIVTRACANALNKSYERKGSISELKKFRDELKITKQKDDKLKYG